MAFAGDVLGERWARVIGVVGGELTVCGSAAAAAKTALTLRRFSSNP